uniref:MAL activator protein n=1 Tax=Saccharomyces pastorianus TaxID=27292 RepID=Q9UVH4_SACPS|nr:MAL activator protein [Saccharomyces pastorianus]
MSIARQSCDCCRVRRVKCDRNKPCSRCHQRNLNCILSRPLKKRGPKSIRAKSLRKIAEVQMVSMNSNIMVTPVALMKVPKKVIEQCLRLYQDNLYVIWPMLSYDDLHKLLEEKYDDCYTYCFLVSLSAATLSDLQTEIRSEEGVPFTGEQLCSLCMLSRQFIDDLSNSDIFRIMTYYCLHRCYAQFADTRTSYRLSCEAIGIIKMGGFHREETYEFLPFGEQQLRRKVYYLLLMTERYYAVYFHVVASLDAIVAPPLPEIVTDPRLSLESFLEVIRVFTVPGKCFFDALRTNCVNDSCTEESLRRIWNELHTVSLAVKPWSYGYIDFLFSRHWVRTLAWKLVLHMKGMRMNFLSSASSTHIPVKIARDMLGDTFLTPKNLYDVHGPGIPMKALEIANALVDVVNKYDHNMKLEAWNVLYDVSKFVFSLKHCNNKMVEMFSTKCQNALITLPISKPLQLNHNSKNDESIVP